MKQFEGKELELGQRGEGRIQYVWQRRWHVLMLRKYQSWVGVKSWERSV